VQLHLIEIIAEISIF